MTTRDLADPEYEPSDDELRELMHRAFSDVKARHEAALRALREDISRRIALASGTGVPKSPG